MEHKHRRNLVVTLVVVVALIGAAFVVKHQNAAGDVVMGREFVQDVKQFDLDTPDELKLSEELEHVTQEVGQKESMMADSEILSDGAEKEADQIEMDKAQDDEEQDPVLVDEKDDGEEEDTGKQETDGEAAKQDDDADLDFLSDEEAAKQPAVAVEEDRRYPRPQCRRIRRCYHKYCSKRKPCKRICRRRRVCRRYGRRVRCVIRPYCYNHCPVCRSRCGVICRLRMHCRRVPRVTCYNRYCVRRFCARRCVRKGVRCRRYRRCYRRCVGVCGRRNRRCQVKCYHYKRCHALNRCYNRCFVRRQVCGRRCVRRRV